MADSLRKQFAPVIRKLLKRLMRRSSAGVLRRFAPVVCKRLKMLCAGPAPVLRRSLPPYPPYTGGGSL
jgi:hypothetical protein